jgi:recombination protein RecA
MQSTTLRAQLESALDGRISTPFTDLDGRVCETVSTGIATLDAKIGGLPRGAVTEIFGPASSGKTSILLSILTGSTAREEVCALVDGCDAFSPESGRDAGIDLRRLLWVRCHNLDQTLKVTDLLLQSGGFGVVAMDLSDLPANAVHGVPLSTWFRFQRSIEKTPTILAIASRDGVAKTCAAVAMKTSKRCAVKEAVPSHAILLEDSIVNVEVIRKRNTPHSYSRVCFHLHSSFSCPVARP